MAQRLHAQKSLERASDRLRTAGPMGIAVARLVPGLRVYTAIVAGTAGIELRIFLLGAIPAIIVWLAIFTLIGVLVGVPALASLSHVQHLAVTGAALVAIGLATLVGIRHLPQGDAAEPSLPHAPLRLLLLLSIVVEVIVASSVVSGVTELLRERFGLADPPVGAGPSRWNH